MAVFFLLGGLAPLFFMCSVLLFLEEGNGENY